MLPLIALWIFAFIGAVGVLVPVLTFLSNRKIVYMENRDLAEKCVELMNRLRQSMSQLERDGVETAVSFRQRLSRHEENGQYLFTWTQVFFDPYTRQEKLKRLSRNLQLLLGELQRVSGAGSFADDHAVEIEEVSPVRPLPDTLRRRAPTNLRNGVAEAKGMMDRRVGVSEIEVDSPAVSETLYSRPRKSAYFVGRITELRHLTEILREHGSAAITGYGGLGKSQLMTAFAERAEVEGDVPGGVFWVTADGDASNVVEALVVFVEKLKGVTIADNERQKPEFVLSVLKKVLYEASGRWLLCLDNVDYACDSDVCRILDEVAAMAEPKKNNGWVVVTSRCGPPTLWDSMVVRQNVVLGPLSVEDAMYVLWRYKASIRSNNTADEEIAEAVALFEQENESEYRALRDLCGYGWCRSLAGLPLALIHAGAYIRRFGCSFSEYLELYRKANGKSELAEVFRKAHDFALRNEQRAILTTWSISMSRLSEESRLIVRAVAMLGNERIPDDLMKETLGENQDPNQRRVMFHKIVLEELVFDSSLLRRHETEDGTSFSMHRIVRLFILVDMEQDKEMQRNAFEKGIIATHSCVDSILKKLGKKFHGLPNSPTDQQFRYFPHSYSLLNHFTSSSIAVSELSKVAQLCEFSGACLYWTGRLKEAAAIQESLLVLRRTIHGQNAVHGDISSALNELGNVLYVQGKYKEAEKSYLESLDIEHSIHGQDVAHVDIAITLHNLGGVFQAQGKYRQAERIYRKALDMELLIHGYDEVNDDIAVSFHNLGSLFVLQGKVLEAEAMYRKSLDMEYSIYGHHAVRGGIAVSLKNLASVFREQGKLVEAECMFEKSLGMLYSIHGEDALHADIAALLGGLGLLFRAQGKLLDAEKMHRKALVMNYSIHGEDAAHASIAIALKNLGSLFSAQQKHGEAEAMYRKSLEMRYVIHGECAIHPEILELLRELGGLLISEGKAEEAEAVARKAMEMEIELDAQDNYEVETTHEYGMP